MSKNDIFSKHSYCNPCQSDSPYLKTNNLLSEFQNKSEIEKAIARENLGIKDNNKNNFDNINFKDIKGLAVANLILNKSFEDNKVVLECTDGTVVINKKEEKQLSGIYKTTYELSVVGGNGSTQQKEIKIQGGNNISVVKFGDTYTISSNANIISGEDPANKVTEINSDSTDEEYPSALAVYNFLVESLKNIEIDIKYAKTEDVANDVDSILYGD